MRIANSRDLGLYARERRQDIGKSQTDLAALAGVSRRWLADMESGKPTVELELVLKTLTALGMSVDILEEKPASSKIELDQLLSNFGIGDDLD